jgi:hypothetical protein
MATEVKSRKKKRRLADDLRESLEEALRWARGEETGAIVHTVVPSAAKARRARQKLGLSQPTLAWRTRKDRKTP